MKLLVIDTETTGISRADSAIIQIAAVIEDTAAPDVPLSDLPAFNVFVHPGIICSRNDNFCMVDSWVKKTNDHILSKAIKEGESLLNALTSLAGFSVDALNRFPGRRKPAVVWCGANPSFDWDFIRYGLRKCRQLAGDKTHNISKVRTVQSFVDSVNGRFVDPSAYFVDWSKDITMPSLQKCIARAGMDNVVEHDALADCRDTVAVLRKATDNYK